MFPKMDPRQMASLMRQMGIKNEEIPASRVVIETSSGKKIIIDSPSVVAIDMQGQKSYQVSGSAREIESKVSSEEQFEVADDAPQDTGKMAESDISLVAEQAKVGREEARRALEATSGDIASAIMSATKSDYLEERRGQRELLKVLEMAKAPPLKDKLPMLYEKSENDQLKAASAWHQLGRESFSRMMSGESSEVREEIKARLGRIASESGGIKTLIRQELLKKASELADWI